MPQALPGQWYHQEPRAGSLAATIEAGYARALSGDWSSGTEGDRARAMWGFVIELAAVMGRLAGSVEVNGDQVRIDPAIHPEVAQERKQASARLYRTADVLMNVHESSGGLTTSTPTDTGAVPAFALVVLGVAISIAGAAAVGYLGQKALEVVNQELARKDQLQQLAKVHAQVSALVRAHVNREDQLGKSLPLDPATKSALDTLGKAQESIGAAVAPGSPESFGAAFGKTLGTGVVLVGALALLWIVNTHKDGKS